MDIQKERLFIDTNLILDVIEGRKKESKRVLEEIRKTGGYCCTSSFAICEAIDKEQEFKYATNLLTVEKRSIDEIVRTRRQKTISQSERKEAVEKVNGFLKNNPVEVFTIRERGWDTALKMLEDLRIDACDSVHLATALEAKCSIFITSDEQLGGEIAKSKLMKWLSPERVLEVLKVES